MKKEKTFEEWLRFEVYAKFWHCLYVLMFITPTWLDFKVNKTEYLSYKIHQAKSNNLDKAYKLFNIRR